MDIYQTLIIGTVTGILSSIIIWLLISIFNKQVIPWYQTFIYRGTDLEGIWEGKEINNAVNPDQKINVVHYIHRVHLKQRGHQVRGVVYIDNIYENNDEDYTSEYKFTGEVSDNNLLISYQRTHNKTIGMGAYLLNVTEKANCLKGSSVFLSRMGQIGSTNDILLERKRW